jgi:hypothetical protein
VRVINIERNREERGRVIKRERERERGKRLRDRYKEITTAVMRGWK